MRRHVARNQQPDLTAIGDRLNALRMQMQSQLAAIAETKNREQLRNISAQLAELQNAGAEATSQLLAIEQQLAQFPLDDVDANRLRQNVIALEDSQRERERLHSQFRKELSELSEQTDQMDVAVRPHLDDTSKGKSSKKKKQRTAQKSIDIDQQIAELEQALASINDAMLPKLGELQRQVDMNNIDLDGAALLQERLNHLADEYKVCSNA